MSGLWGVSVSVLVVALLPQVAPVRIDTAEALAQVVKRVDPVVPEAAAAAKIGGDVIADVVVGPTGAVRSVTVVGGHEMLHEAATAALKQWRFTPFARNGKPVTVQVILEVAFPDPVRDAERRAFEGHRAAERRCLEGIDREPADAPRLCEELVRLSGGLPKDRVLERSHAFVLYANSLVAAGRVADAVNELKRAIDLREPVAGPADADTADAYYAVGVLQQRIGNTREADAALETAVRMHEAALKEVPRLRDVYLPRFGRALRAYAALKRQLGENEAAEALEARASALPAPAPPSHRSRRITIADDLRLLEPTASPLPSDEVKRIRAALSNAGLRAWMLMHHGSSERQGTSEWFVEAFLTPATVTPTTRRGEVVAIVRRGSSSWDVEKVAWFWVQIAAGDDPAAEFPIKIQSAPNSPPPSVNEIASVLRLVRANPDVKAWPVEMIVYGRDGASMTLEEHETRARQHLTLRREGSAWTIGDIRTFPAQPH